MKMKKNFVLQEVADEYIVVPVGEEADRTRGIIKLNATGASLWKQLTEKNVSQNELVNLILNEYHIEKDQCKD